MIITFSKLAHFLWRTLKEKNTKRKKTNKKLAYGVEVEFKFKLQSSIATNKCHQVFFFVLLPGQKGIVL